MPSPLLDVDEGEARYPEHRIGEHVAQLAADHERCAKITDAAGIHQDPRDRPWSSACISVERVALCSVR